MVATPDVTPRVVDVQAFIDAQRVSPLQRRLLFLCFVVIAIDGFDSGASHPPRIFVAPGSSTAPASLGPQWRNCSVAGC